jgi:hypothetical protein
MLDAVQGRRNTTVPFPPDPDAAALEKIWLKEEIETGALDRMMQTPPAADETGIMWTTWEDTDQD